MVGDHLGDHLGDQSVAETGIRTPAKKLTAAFVAKTTAAGKHFDGNGLYLFVKPNGAKQWKQRITIRGKRCELGLGSVSLVTLAEAREKALANRKLVHAGGDPRQAKREAEAMLTYEQAARTVHALNLPTWKNVKHGAQFISTLETYVFPSLGNSHISEITNRDVMDALLPIWNTKEETARRVKQRISKVMQWAIAQGMRQDNPADNITTALPKQKAKVQPRKALPYTQVHTCVQVVKASGAGLSTKLALEFLILTAVRSGEVRGATWDEIEFGTSGDANPANPANRATWTIPAERMKMDKEHSVPLCPRAVEILHEAKAISDGSNLIFAGTKTGKPLSDMTLSKLVKEQGFEADVHGFRTSFRTWTQEQTSYDRETCEAALAHGIKDKSEAAYARSDYFDKRRAMMNDWADYIAKESA